MFTQVPLCVSLFNVHLLKPGSHHQSLWQFRIYPAHKMFNLKLNISFLYLEMFLLDGWGLTEAKIQTGPILLGFHLIYRNIKPIIMLRLLWIITYTYSTVVLHPSITCCFIQISRLLELQIWIKWWSWYIWILYGPFGANINIWQIVRRANEFGNLSKCQEGVQSFPKSKLRNWRIN